jgi:hypothetical protein
MMAALFTAAIGRLMLSKKRKSAEVVGSQGEVIYGQ